MSNNLAGRCRQLTTYSLLLTTYSLLEPCAPTDPVNTLQGITHY